MPRSGRVVDGSGLQNLDCGVIRPSDGGRGENRGVVGLFDPDDIELFTANGISRVRSSTSFALRLGLPNSSFSVVLITLESRPVVWSVSSVSDHLGMRKRSPEGQLRS